jgi:hypothetical protein
MGDQKSTANTQALYDAAILEYKALLFRIDARAQAGITPTESELLEDDRIRLKVLSTRRAVLEQIFPPQTE